MARSPVEPERVSANEIPSDPSVNVTEQLGRQSLFARLGHVYPVQLLFNLVKGVVADLVTGPPRLPRPARRLQRSAPGVDVNGESGCTFVGVRLSRFQMSEKLLAGG